MERVFDIEADGLKATKIHCLSSTGPKGIRTTGKYQNMANFFEADQVLVGHNITRYDIPTVERILGVKCKGKLVDTLALSWYLYPDRLKHGLESWGEDLGFAKPPIDDWENLSYEEYVHRCESDVEINLRLWEKIKKDLLRLYGSEEKYWRLIDYLTFKMSCAAEQEKVGWKLDVDFCKHHLEIFQQEVDLKVAELKEAMPQVPRMVKRSKPAKPYKMNGELSSSGVKWLRLLIENGLPEDHEDDVEVVHSYQEPNPNSHVQIKNWLFSMGWEPQTFSYKRDKETNEFTKIPQVKNGDGDGVCESVKKLFVKEPALELLEGLSVLNHRISILKGFLDNVDENGYVQAQIQGLTNTLRFKHKVVVNLPGVDKPYGDIIRGCLIAPDGYELCGSDMSGLEDRTKQHYMWDYDPDYVLEMTTPDFDPHLDLGVLAKMMSQEDADRFKEEKDIEPTTPHCSKFKPIRHASKQINYSATYGVTPAGIVRNTGMPLKDATSLHTTFWKRNWSVQAVADACEVKTFNKTKWLYNPVSGLWYSLRTEKDRFSTLNQGTGVWCFDTWMRFVSEGGPPVCGQFHDEGVWVVRKGLRDKLKAHIQKAMDKTNEFLKLNRELDCDVKFGKNYSEIH